MAWRVESLDDLKEFYHRIKDKNVPIDRVADHGVSLGIYSMIRTATASRSITNCRAQNGRARSRSSPPT